MITSPLRNDLCTTLQNVTTCHNRLIFSCFDLFRGFFQVLIQIFLIIFSNFLSFQKTEGLFLKIKDSEWIKYRLLKNNFNRTELRPWTSIRQEFLRIIEPWFVSKRLEIFTINKNKLDGAVEWATSWLLLIELAYKLIFLNVVFSIYRTIFSTLTKG